MASKSAERDRSVGDSPTLLLCCYKGGRVALIAAVLLQRSVGDSPTLMCVATKEGESPTFILCCYKGGRVALPPLVIEDEAQKSPVDSLSGAVLDC